MRIISGKYQKVILECMKGDNTRPTLDRIKETVFNILNNYIYFDELDEIIDLYAGSGALGIECLSRGSKKVNFIDNNSGAIDIINKNISKLKIEKEKYNVTTQKASYFLLQFKNEKRKSDLIFLDPPFKNNIKEIIEYIIDEEILAENGIIYYETDDNEKITEIIKILEEKNITILKSKKIGRMKILIAANILKK